MFTGLIETAGKVVRFEEGSAAFDLVVDHGGFFNDVVGDSIAVNGCCLTATRLKATSVGFDLLAETVRLTGFRSLSAGNLVNLERSLLPTSRMGGHFVSGHVDGTGEVQVFEPRGKDHYLKVKSDPAMADYLVSKGSIAIDGISLTVAEVHEEGFAVWLIPHTLEVTNLKERSRGDLVNLEFDLLAKYVASMIRNRTGENRSEGWGQ